jgi:type I restriction enzyme M protein
MLDSETKRRIDTARNILVGKVPDPKSQVEQITIALIYKFMNDMDAEAEEMGGKRKYFVGEYAKYSWANLISPALSGFEVVTLYGEAIEKMTHNDDIPKLFRDIFKNAYLPYRDPETLKLFLKTINEFSYSHSEKLGDAFEYLLSVLGSQGDAGQFRTPRHIIDFMVRVVDPQKDESLLDPACGTAGFLISAYKHILASNSKDGKPGAGLKPAERKKLADNVRGYDISPDMVRLSLVNLYLHGFATPNIYEYDTLTSEDRWNETADVILANPPFMSPKGGIKPHKRFSVQSNRSEVLFVDYMAEHLSLKGRAAIIVPEGIIFQSAGAYKQLRQYLVEQNYLWAVVSLPAGVFNPYAGVKTSILLLDKTLAQKTDQILFVKIEKDGYDLGAQRKALCNEMDDKPELCPKHSDLPDVLNTLQAWQKAILDGKAASFTPTIDSALLTSSSKLAEYEYNLSADRYRESVRIGKQTHPMIAIGDICTFEYGKPLKAENRIDGEYPVYGSNGIVGYHNEYLVKSPFLVVGRKGSAGEVHYSEKNGFPIDTTFYVKLENEDKVLLKYLFHILKSLNLGDINTQAGVPGLNRNDAYKTQIPLPPLQIQRQIVDEIAAHQQIIGGARQVVEGWKPDIELELDEVLENAEEIIWKRIPLVEVCEQITDGTHVTPKYTDSGVPFLRVTDITESNDSKKFISEEEHRQLIKRCKPVQGDVLYSKNGTIGVAKLVDWDWEFSIFVSLAMLKPKRDILDGKYLEFFLNSDDALAQAFAHSKSGTVTNLHLVEIKQMEIPLPPLEIQREIVARIESERKIVEGNRELIRIYEGKVKKVIQRVWEG